MSSTIFQEMLKTRNYNLFVEDETTGVDQQYIPPINNQPFDYK